jgi:hypothetical protein
MSYMSVISIVNFSKSANLFLQEKSHKRNGDGNAAAKELPKFVNPDCVLLFFRQGPETWTRFLPYSRLL